MSRWQSVGSRAFLLKIVEDLRGSYWFVPAVMVLGAVLLAAISVTIDANREALPTWMRLPESFLTTQADGARQTLAVISQSVLGVAGVMFSMTLVAVSFAAGNYGPRLIGNFMRDRGNQLSLGILISTFVYALLILRAVDQPDSMGQGGFVPHHSMAIALGLTFLSILTVIYFVHHVPEMINVSQITAGLGRRFSNAIREAIDRSRDGHDSAEDDWPEGAPDHELALPVAGYIQAVNYSGLKRIAKDEDIYVGANRRVGDFVHPRQPLIEIWGLGNRRDEDLHSRLQACFAVGNAPTEEQNLIFIGSQLVEMTARALSPGVNDPNTAINCLNWLHQGLVDALQHEGGFPPVPRQRVRLPELTYRALHRATFGDALAYVASDPMALARMAWLLQDLSKRADGTDRAFILTERKRLMALATKLGSRPEFDDG